MHLNQHNETENPLSKRVDVIRFIAMYSVIWGHCLYDWEHSRLTADALGYSELILLEAGRIGTISFFLISGYCMSNKVDIYNISTYLRSRLKTVILPWIIFLSIYVLIQASRLLTISDLGKPLKVLSLCAGFYKTFIFHATYWFVPVALICGSLMIALSKYINRCIVGVLLATCTLFYSVNLYFNWIDVNHTKAVLGYAFFTWLGIMLKRHEQKAARYLAKIGWLPIILMFTFFYTMACNESAALKHIGSGDPFASIRFSNIIVSLLFFISFLKMRRFSWLRYFGQGKLVYGLYLVHSIVMSELWRFIPVLPKNDIRNLPLVISVHLFLFLLTLTLSTAIVFIWKFFTADRHILYRQRSVTSCGPTI